MTVRRRAAAWLAALCLAQPALAEPDPADWEAVLAEAEGQTVYFHAWGGAEQSNDHIAWAGEQLAARHGVTVEHVKLSDTAEAVSRVLAEKTAGRDTGGAVDLVWINGENFAAMKAQGLLFGPWAEALPNWALVDVDGLPVRTDFTVPTEGLEAPWTAAQLVFFHDAARTPEPPRSMPRLLDWARANPGRFTFPQPPDFLGSTFLKQALIELVPDRSVLSRPVEAADYAAVTAEFWAFMEDLTPHLWRSGRAYPQTGPRLIQLMADGEIDLGLTFNPSEVTAAIRGFALPDTVESYTLDGGTLGNVSFVAIPYNASAKAGAMVLANFLMSPVAQARQRDPAHWGLGTVLDVAALPEEARAPFAGLDLGPGSVAPEEMAPALPEPHPSWMVALEEDWTARFGVRD
jgi:putative thiamine transport system substrate-binding protein